MGIMLALLAGSGVYCFGVFRYTRHLPTWRRPLVRSLLLALLCPAFPGQFEALDFTPLIFCLIGGFPLLQPEHMNALVCQALAVWGLVYGLSMAWVELPALQLDDQDNRRLVRWAAIMLSLPSWGLIAGAILFRIWLDGTAWPPTNWMFFASLVCAICSMGALTISLVFLGYYSTSRWEVVLVFWSGFPLLLGALSVCWLFFRLTIGDLSWTDLTG
jgi:hypothetical protein